MQPVIDYSNKEEGMKTRKWKEGGAALLSGTVLLAVPVLAVLFFSSNVLGGISAGPSSDEPAAVAKAPDDGLLRVASLSPGEKRTVPQGNDELRNWADTQFQIQFSFSFSGRRAPRISFTFRFEEGVRLSIRARGHRIQIRVRRVASFANNFGDSISISLRF